MLNVDVVSLRQFYSSELGQLTSYYILRAIRRIWPDFRQDKTICLGYMLPYLDGLEEECSLLAPMMLASQGGIRWPREQDNRVSLVRESALPLPHDSVNRVLVLHVMEHSRSPAKVLEEIWRVLVPGGRALLVVPNRRGLWTLASSTPFGHGHPYSLQQIGKRLGDKGFTLVRYQTALFPLPVDWKWLRFLAPVFEWLGRLLLDGSGGVILVEVEKQIYASIAEPVEPVGEEVLIPVVQ